MLECTVVCFGRGLCVGVGVKTCSLQSDVFTLVCTHDGPLAYHAWDDQHVLCIVCEAVCFHPGYGWPQEDIEWYSLMVLCVRLLAAVVCAVLTAASVVEGIAYASAILNRICLHDTRHLMMWVAFCPSCNTDQGVCCVCKCGTV